MDSESRSSDHDAQDTSSLRESVSMVIRQLQMQPQLPRPQPARAPSDEIPESEVEEEEEEEAEAGDDSGDDHTRSDGDSRGHDGDSDGDGSGDGNGDNDKSDDHVDHVSDPEQHSPSVASAVPSGSASQSDHHSLRPEPATQEEAAKPPSPPSPRPRSAYSTVPPTPTHWPSPRKRSRSPGVLSLSHAAHARPVKRPRGAFNHAYLALLNEDIRDAAARFTPHDWAGGAAAALGPSQIGLTHWSEAEKMLFFEALARLGRDDAAGIAARIRTKSEFEVAHYLALLARASSANASSSSAAAAVVPADLPAAVELSQACCAALEEAADAIAARQETHEQAAERRRWGDGRWLVAPWNRAELEKDPVAPSVGFFRVREWLRLAERVFMNAALEDYNWACVSAEKPSIRTTALEDFYTLAVSVTRRLVAATIYVSESRVRAKRALYPETSSRVWRQDVEAAALSLGLPTNSRRFWARCARRLRLDVYDDEYGGEAHNYDDDDDNDENYNDDDDDGHGEGGGDVSGWETDEAEWEPMSYDEVERALGFEPEGAEYETSRDWDEEEELDSSEEEDVGNDHDDELAASAESDAASIELGFDSPDDSAYEEPPRGADDEAEREAVKREMDELLVHSALEYPRSKRARDALRSRVRAARAHEAHADALDARASYCEEKRLWALLDRQPPVELARVDVPAEPPRHAKKTVDDLIRGFSRTPGSGGWRSRLDVVPSRWEMEFALAEEEEEEEEERRKQEEEAAMAESGLDG